MHTSNLDYETIFSCARTELFWLLVDKSIQTLFLETLGRKLPLKEFHKYFKCFTEFLKIRVYHKRVILCIIYLEVEKMRHI